MSLPSPISHDYFSSSHTQESLGTLHDSSSSSTMFSCTHVASTEASSTSSKKLPSLDDILANDAPFPYNLSAFVDFLSQNHCLETVEFTMDVARYAAFYFSPEASKEKLLLMWNKVVDTYIRPDGPKELNLTCEVKKQLTTLSQEAQAGEPPEPENLEKSVEMVKDMMKENAYQPFIASIRCAHASDVPRRNSHPRPDSCLHQLDAPVTMCSSLPVHSPFACPVESSWHQPMSWIDSGRSYRTTASKASSTDSLFGEERLRTNPVTPPESPGTCEFSCGHTESPATPAVLTTKSNCSHPPALPTRTSSHWRKMSQRLKWRRGSDNQL